MNYKCTPDFPLFFFFFGFQINDEAPLFYWRRKKKIISTEMDDGLAFSWKRNSCNRNGNVLPSIWSRSGVEMHSQGGNLSYRAFLFPSSLSLWPLLITRRDAERGLFGAWQKSESMNLMSLLILSTAEARSCTDTQLITHRRALSFSLILYVALRGWSPSQYVLGRSLGNTLDEVVSTQEG